MGSGGANPVRKGEEFRVLWSEGTVRTREGRPRWVSVGAKEGDTGGFGPLPGRPRGPRCEQRSESGELVGGTGRTSLTCPLQGTTPSTHEARVPFCFRESLFRVQSQVRVSTWGNSRVSRDFQFIRRRIFYKNKSTNLNPVVVFKTGSYKTPSSTRCEGKYDLGLRLRRWHWERRWAHGRRLCPKGRLSAYRAVDRSGGGVSVVPPG